MLMNLHRKVREQLHEGASDWLRLRSIQRDHSRFGWRQAPPFTTYLKDARRAFSGQPAMGRFAAESKYFEAHQFVSAVTDETTRVLSSAYRRVMKDIESGRNVFVPAPFLGPQWGGHPEIEQIFRGDLGNLIRAAFRSEFKIAHGAFGFKKGGMSGPKIWHSDAGPGTCLNVFAYLSEGQRENGPTAILPWAESVQIFGKESAWLRDRLRRDPEMRKDKKLRREAMAGYYKSEIEGRFADKVAVPSGPAGLMVIFNNNTLHAAQAPQPGHDRLVATFRVYPAITPPDFARLSETGISGKRGYPEPREEF